MRGSSYCGCQYKAPCLTQARVFILPEMSELSLWVCLMKIPLEEYAYFPLLRMTLKVILTNTA